MISLNLVRGTSLIIALHSTCLYRGSLKRLERGLPIGVLGFHRLGAPFWEPLQMGLLCIGVSFLEMRCLGEVKGKGIRI